MRFDENFILGRVGENYLGEHEGHSDDDGSDDDAAAEELLSLDDLVDIKL